MKRLVAEQVAGPRPEAGGRVLRVVEAAPAKREAAAPDAAGEVVAQPAEGLDPIVDALVRATYANGLPTYVRGSVDANREALEVAPGRLEVVRRGSEATVIAFGPMVSRTLEACEGLDVSILYATSVKPFDREALAGIVGREPLVLVVEPFYEGTSVPAVAEALRHVPSRIVPIGVPRVFLHRYGSASEHDRALGLDAAGIRRRIAAALD